MATVLIEIPDQQAAALNSYAQAQGLTLEQCIVQLVQKATPLQPADLPTGKDDRPIWEIFAHSIKAVPAEVMATMPTDGASQHDHYIYGWPKREE